jgi:hypothetical protein
VDTKHKTSDSTWTPRETVTLAALTNFPRATPAIALSPYGGRTDLRAKATGFFRTERVNGLWWLVDPEGCLALSVGPCSVTMNRTAHGQAALNAKFGTPEKWATATATLLRDTGHNTLGCWSDWDRLSTTKPRLPYTVSLSLMGTFGRSRGATQGSGHMTYPDNCMPIFDPEFPAFCAKRAAEVAAPLKKDPWLVGYFSDNELPWPKDLLGRCLRLPESSAGRRAAEKWLADRNGSADAEAFLEFAATTYFRIVSAALRAADPHHLYLGCRFHGGDLRTPALFKAASRPVDVISANYYGAWTPDDALLREWGEWSGRPFLITEWYAKGMDSGMANGTGAGWTVRTQRDRGLFYQNFTLGLLKNPGCIGWHWFKYMDNDPTDTRADPSNRDSNKGVVSNSYEPYAELLGAMKEINTRVYALRDYFQGGPAAR